MHRKLPPNGKQIDKAKDRERQKQMSHFQNIEDAYRLLSQAAREAVCIFEPETSAETWLSPLDPLLELPSGVMSPKLSNLIDFVAEPDRLLYEKEWAGLMAHHTASFQFRLVNYRGESVWFHLHAAPAQDADGRRGVVIGLRDVDLTRRASDKSAEMMRLQAIETMAAGLAHEFNNHLTPIRGFIELSLEEMDTSQPRFQDLQSALQKVSECSDLVAHIQSYGGKQVLQPRPTEVGRITGSLVRTTLAALGPSGQGIEVVENIEEDLPMVLVDNNAYREMIRNIVQNSVEAIDACGTITLMIRVEQIDPDTKRPSKEPGSRPFVRVRIIDSGEGISDEDLKRIVDPFYTTRDRAEKRGIGLSVVQGIVRQHGGWLKIDSTTGVGTAVTLYFPVAELSQPVVFEEAAQPTQIPAARMRSSVPAGRVLVGDDEDIIRQMVSRVFAREGWCIEEAHDYHEVLEMANDRDAGHFDLFILDMTMSGPASVEENLARLDKSAPGAPILIMSGAARDRFVDHLMRRYNCEFVKKPFSPSYLLEVVEQMLLPPASRFEPGVDQHET